MVREGLDKILGLQDGEAGVFAGEVGGEPEDLVGLLEGGAVLIEDLVLAGVLVGLVDDGEGFEVFLVGEFAGHLDGGDDFFWVVGVIGVDVGGELFEATAGAREGVEGFDDGWSVWMDELEGLEG